jgi:hypothetical protein
MNSATDTAIGGFRRDEALQFIEFCVELDNQDDRAKRPHDQNLNPMIDPALWDPAPLFDSRDAVADDAFGYAKDPGNVLYQHWTKLYSAIVSKADLKYSAGWTASTIASDPDLNGFGPWENAWLLYRGKGRMAGAHTIAIRGTVFSDAPSAVENAWFHTVEAVRFLSAAVQFADAANASLHSGFAHASFTLLLDDRYGILRILEERGIPAGSPLYITGHSQGAAMTSLVHAFMYYAMRNDEAAEKPVFGLKGKRYRLKSYGFAQPKPGDYAFNFDFASITQANDAAIVINNTIDAVPQVPMTLQALGDLTGDFKGGGVAERTIQFLSSAGSGIRRTIALVAEPFEKRSAEGYGYFYHYAELTDNGTHPLGSDTTASTWNFAPAGHVLFVYGTPGDPADTFLQHHAWTYRRLIREQLHD